MIVVNLKTFTDYAAGTVFRRVSDGMAGKVERKNTDFDASNTKENQTFAVFPALNPVAFEKVTCSPEMVSKEGTL